jgi:hypothetical protein
MDNSARLTFSQKVQIFNGDSQPWQDMGLPEECLQPMDGDYVSDQLDKDGEGGRGASIQFSSNLCLGF